MEDLTVEFYASLTAENPHQEPQRPPSLPRDVKHARGRAIDRGALVEWHAVPAVAAEPAPDTEPEPCLLGSSSLPALIQVAGFGEAEKSKAVQLGYVVAEAFGDFGGTIAEWNALDDSERDAKLYAKIEHLKDTGGEG